MCRLSNRSCSIFETGVCHSLKLARDSSFRKGAWTVWRLSLLSVQNNDIRLFGPDQANESLWDSGFESLIEDEAIGDDRESLF